MNRGEDVTKGLRKVDKSEMTHKNPSLRAGSVVPATVGASSAGSPAAKKPARPTKPHALAGKKPTKFVLEGNKWLIVRRLLCDLLGRRLIVDYRNTLRTRAH